MISHNERTWRALNKPAKRIYQIFFYINAFPPLDYDCVIFASITLLRCIFETFLKRQVGGSRQVTAKEIPESGRWAAKCASNDSDEDAKMINSNKNNENAARIDLARIEKREKNRKMCLVIRTLKQHCELSSFFFNIMQLSCST